MSDFDLTEAPQGVRRVNPRAAKKDVDESDQAEPAGGVAGALINLQRTAGNAGTAALIEEQIGEEHPVERLLRSDSGQPLESEVRGRMEERLGADFSDVRIHTGAEASRSAEAVQASAYTVGEDVVLRDDHLKADTPEGERTLTHELTHVIQQRSGPVEGTETSGGIKVSDPSDRFERAAEHVASGQTSASGEAGGAVQRQTSSAPEELEEEEELQPAVQRQAEVVPEEEEEEELLP